MYDGSFSGWPVWHHRRSCHPGRDGTADTSRSAAIR